MQETRMIVGKLAGLVAACLLGSSLALANGPGWVFSPVLELGQAYSDNIALNPRGEEDGDFATTLDASISAVRQGAQSRLSADYSFFGVAYWSESEQNGFHRLSAAGQVDVVPDRFSLESSARYFQRQRSRAGVGGDLINLGVDRTDVIDFDISPVYTQRFNDTADLLLRYTFALVDYDDSAVRDNSSTRNQLIGQLSSGPQFSRVGWQLSFSRSETDFDDGVKVTLQTAEALVRWIYSPRLNVFAAVGDDNNRFEQELASGGPSDSFWRTGVEWNPSARTSAEAFFGERFFGRTFGGSLRHRLRDGLVFADYSESLQTVNLRSGFFRVPVNGEALDPDFSEDLDPPDFFTGVFLSKRFALGMTINRPRSTLTARVFDERRDRGVQFRSERSQGVRLDGGWQWMPRTRVNGNLSLQERTFSDLQERSDTLFQLRVGLERRLAPQIDGSLSYQYRQRDSSGGGAGFDYRENRVMATVARAF
ncbi:MAG: TIGR03016 family PEP-CTERM system-associated outer membrane protein [Wenzhouxiangella sp.]